MPAKKLDNPLVSLCITCYNQVDTIRGSLESALSQTYSPLEIVVCDDASTDGTFEVISSIVEDYRKLGGQHTVVLRQNDHNLNVIKNYEQCFRMARGELLVTGSGDDVSMPYRVERIVMAWLAAGRKPTVIHHAWYSIDPKGRCCGWGGPRTSYCPLGACSAYRRDVFSSFPPVEEANAYEDMVFCPRACMLGETLRLDDKLVCYRYGGTTASFYDHFDMALKGSRRELDSQRQMAKDIEYGRERFDADRVKETEANNLRRKEEAIKRLEFLEARSGLARWRVGRKNGLFVRNTWSLFSRFVYVFPKFIANPISNLFFHWEEFKCVYVNNYRNPPKEYLAVKKYCLIDK